MLKKKKGFTLVELIIVIIIVGVLSIVAVPIYFGYTRKSMATEANALMSAIKDSESTYYSENGHYLEVSKTCMSEELDVDARANKYFTSFEVGEIGDTYSAVSEGIDQATGISVTLIGPTF